MSNGVIKTLSSGNKTYYTNKEVQELLGVSRSKAYSMIRTMRQECIDAGKITKVYPEGKVPKKYFDEMCMIK